jgi:hypothetical protein
MPFCPKCRTEYIEGTEKCEKCGSTLTDSLPEQDEPVGKPVFLASTDTGVETDMLGARLESAGIPCYIKPHDSDGILQVYMGENNLGADFFVPEDCLEQARAAADLPEEKSGASAPLQPHGKKSVRGTIITIIAIVLILIAFFLLDALLGQIRGAFGLN